MQIPCFDYSKFAMAPTVATTTSNSKGGGKTKRNKGSQELNVAEDDTAASSGTVSVKPPRRVPQTFSEKVKKIRHSFLEVINVIMLYDCVCYFTVINVIYPGR